MHAAVAVALIAAVLAGAVAGETWTVTRNAANTTVTFAMTGGDSETIDVPGADVTMIGVRLVVVAGAAWVCGLWWCAAPAVAAGPFCHVVVCLAAVSLRPVGVCRRRAWRGWLSRYPPALCTLICSHRARHRRSRSRF